jgi:hypothetical protein
MAEARRIEIGFTGGQVVAMRLEHKQVEKLRKEVDGGSGWYDIETEEGAVSLDLAKVVFIKAAGAPHTIGFSGT